MKRVFQKPQMYWFIFIFLLYVSFAIILSEFYVTLRYLPFYLQQIDWLNFLFSFLITFIIAALVSLNIVYAYVRYKEKQAVKKEGAAACAATLLGLSTGVCPVCVSGVFPLFFSFFGISFSWLILPFDGMEIQLLTILLLSMNVWFLKKK